jgi:predicted TIM-barrel fold metal-dependent hydrolase
LSVGIQPGALEFVFDTTRAIMSLMLSGTLTRCPDIRFIFAHGGGALPALRERVDYVISEEQALAARLPNGIGEFLRKLYFDVVLVTNQANFALLTQVMPPEHLLLGTDFPFVPPSHTVTGLRSLGLDPSVLSRIE